jgi:hypothetical protein
MSLDLKLARREINKLGVAHLAPFRESKHNVMKTRSEVTRVCVQNSFDLEAEMHSVHA